MGGGVRDLLLGREPKDFDIATNATPGEIKKVFRNCRLIGRRFRLAHIHFHDEIIEVATFRSMVSDEPEAVDAAPVAEQAPSEPTNSMRRTAIASPGVEGQVAFNSRDCRRRRPSDPSRRACSRPRAV